MVNTEYKFNVAFAKARGLTDKEIDALQGVYIILHQILARPNMHCQTPREAVSVVESIETTLQLMWKFPLDKSFHNYWYDLSGCSCAKRDNRERAGTFSKIITENCPYHGVNKAETWEDRRFR